MLDDRIHNILKIFIRILEQNGFRSAVFEALNGAAEKGKKM